jgi:hypothetical protein
VAKCKYLETTITNQNFTHKEIKGRLSLGNTTIQFTFFHISIRYLKKFFFFLGGAATQRVSWPPHSWGFLDHDAPQSVGLLWTSDQLVAETSTWQHTTLTTDKHPSVVFKPTMSAGERPQTYALDCTATGTSKDYNIYNYNFTSCYISCELWCVTLKKERRLRMLEIRVQRKKFWA